MQVVGAWSVAVAADVACPTMLCSGEAAGTVRPGFGAAAAGQPRRKSEPRIAVLDVDGTPADLTAALDDVLRR